MKLLKYIIAFACIGLLSSCEDYFGTDANVNPDEPINVSANVILPQIQARMAYTYGGDFARYLGLNTRQVDGVERQFAVLGQYGMIGGDVNTPWTNLYSGCLNANLQMVNASQEEGSNHFIGVAKLLEAYIMMMVTDVWGDVPYSDALGFAENAVYQPTFDDQQSIYNAIFALIDEGRTLLNGDVGARALAGDLIYGGDISKWLKFANVLEARGRLHLSKVDGSAYSNVIAALNRGGFDGPADDFALQFGTPANENAPWFQYIEQRDDCEVGGFYVDLMTSLGDPRVATYGAIHDGSHPIFVKDRNLVMIGYTEQEFMKAEALLSTDPEAAFAAYINAVTNSFSEAQVEDSLDDYLASSAIATDAGSLTLEEIMTQKYISMNTNPEAFNDWRRTNIPNIPPVTGQQVPRRFPYPENEFLANQNTPSPAEVTIFNRVWWDQ